jgi:uncharacterized protein YacL
MYFLLVPTIIEFIVVTLGVFLGAYLAGRLLLNRTAISPATPAAEPIVTTTAPLEAIINEPITDDIDRPGVLVDTSAIIDGRIADIAGAGFIPGRLVVPRFVLAELQNIADSDDAMRRGRGRRGLEVLNRLRETEGLSVEVTDEDVSSIKEVDAKLVALAQRHSINVLTTDYNLNRVAAIQGVRVLNVNELSNAIRPVVLPGEEMVVRIVQPGKERNQGVGYLADGTMIVVEDGDKMIGQDVETEVTRVFQTVAGKMIFAVPKGTRMASDEIDTTTDLDTPNDSSNETMPKTPKPNGNRPKRGNRNRQSPTKRLEDSIIAATNDPSDRPS